MSDDTDAVDARTRASQSRLAEEAIDAALAGEGGAVALFGEAGIGKSWLLDHLVEASMQRGRVVLCMRPDSFERIPYAAFHQALLGSSDQLGHDEAREELLGALTFEQGGNVESVQRAAVRFFAAVSRRRPVIVAVDDLPLVDDDTIALLAVLVRRVGGHPLLVVGTCRGRRADQTGSFADLLDNLDHRELLTAIEVGPLGRSDLAELVSSLTGMAPAPALLDTLTSLTGGNPFFAREAILGWMEADALVTANGTCRLQDGRVGLADDRRSALLRRIFDGGDPGSVEMARAVAALGSLRTDRLVLAAELAGLEPAEAATGVDALVSRGLLRRSQDEVYVFSHELVRAALYDSIAPGRRWEWHRRVIEWLGNAPVTPATILEVATHASATAAPGDEVALEALIRAADVTSHAAPRSAIPWYEQALSIMPEDDERRTGVLVRLTRSQFLAAMPDGVVATGGDALKRMPVGPERKRLVALVAEALSEAGDNERALEVLERETDATAGSLRLQALRAHLLVAHGRLDEAAPAAAAAEALMASGSAAEQVLALVHLGHRLCLLNHYGDMALVLDDLRRAAEQAPFSAQLTARANVAYLLAICGETKEGERAIEEARELLGRSGWMLFRAELMLAEMLHAYYVGDWAGALALADDIVGEDAATGVGRSAAMRAVQADILANRGRWTDARRAVAPHGGLQSSDAFLLWAAAGIELLTGTTEPAREALERALTSEPVPRSRHVLSNRLADVELAEGRPDAAAELVVDLVRGGSVDADPGIMIEARRIYGTATGDGAMVEAAATEADEHGLVLLQGKCRVALGELGVEPQRYLTEAFVLFRRLGADPWRRRCATELRRLGLKVPRAWRPRPVTLTDAEIQVARLVQNGSRNREIAAALSISVKTVEAYLTRIYNKTGTTSRLELARLLDSGHLH
ncbi:MAG: AAA family ATPase [Actinobacteria bacterium]|nr:AAA family ATPase [Actinomycetota bacterium]